MNRVEQAIDIALGMTGDMKQDLISPKPLQAVVPVPDEGPDDLDVDYKYSRENFYNLIERGQDAITGILELAKESEHPRTYEVAGQLIKTVSEVTERLADLQQKMQFLKEVPDKAPQNVTNALFIGSTKELQQLMKQNKNEAIESKESET